MKNKQQQSLLSCEMQVPSGNAGIDSFFPINKFSNYLIKCGLIGLLLLGTFAQGFSQTTTSFTTAGAGTFNVPASVTKVTVEAWGGGGAGGGVDNSGGNATRAGGGGAGGAYQKATAVTVTPLAAIPVNVGAGGTGVSAANGNPGSSSTFNTAVVVALGGPGGNRAAGPDTAPTNGAVVTGPAGTQNGGSGGSGGTSGTGTSGGGGGGAGDNGAGGNGGTPTAGTAGAGSPNAGGAGATGRSSSGTGASALALSGGGAGGRETNADQTGGDGFQGQIIVTYIAPFTVGSVTPTGGTVIPGRWFPASNTGISINVPVAIDASLTGGTIQLQGKVSSGSYADILGTGSTYTILVGDLGTSVPMSISKAVFETISGFAQGQYMQVTAVISNSAGNSTTGTQNTGILVQGATEIGERFIADGTFTPQAGINSVTVEAWGGGGGGGSSANTSTNGGGGGGGGGYSKSVLPVSLIGYAVTVGAGGTAAPSGSSTAALPGGPSWFNTSLTIYANGGVQGLNNNLTGGGAGGAITGLAVGTNKFAGGTGGNPDVDGGGGGGSSAGTTAIGVNGNPNTVNGPGGAAAGGINPLGGGNGGDGNNFSASAGLAGSAPGGGGGGSNDLNTSAGGAGAAGQVIITYVPPPTIVSILNSVNPIKVGALTQTVAVKFSVSMNTGTNPTIAISGANWGLQAAGAWSLGTVANDTYTTTLTHNGTGETNAAATSTVSLGTPPVSATGNSLQVTTNSAVFTIDTQPPVFSASAPVNNAYVKDTKVSYTLSEALGSGTITWTGTGGGDLAVHTQTLNAGAGELATGAHTNITLFSPPPLVSGANYTITFNGIDVNGNAASTVTSTVVTFDSTPPTVVLTDDQTDAIVRDVDNVTITATFTEAIGLSATIPTISIGGLITNVNMTMTSPLVWTYVWNVPAGNDGPVAVSIAATDLAGNANTAATGRTSYTIDNIAPVFSSTAPVSSAFVSSSNVSYTLSENISAQAGSKITWIQTSIGPPNDGLSPHTYLLTGAELVVGAHPNIPLASVTLVDAVTYSVSFDAVDLAGNPAVTVTNTIVAYDISPPAAFTVGSVITSGGTVLANYWNGTNIGGVNIQVPVDIGMLDPTVVGGTIQLQARISSGVFANIVGASYTILVGDRNTTKTLSLVAANITAIALYAQGVSLQFRAIITDNAGNFTLGIQSATSLTVDTVAPVISATAPASSSFVNSSNVSYTLSEAIAAGAGSKITWLKTGAPLPADLGSPHTYFLTTGAELATGVHTNIPLASVTLVDGVTYSVSFDVVDLAGNPAANVTNTIVGYDITPPAAFTAGSVLTTGGTVVANYWNSTNTGVNVQVPVDILLLDPTVVGGTIQLQARISSGVFANIGAPYTILVGDRNTTKTLSLSSANITAIALYAQGVALQFTAIITDNAANTTTGIQSATSLTVDTVAPVISATAPSGTSLVNSSNVSYTLSEAASAVAGSKVAWIRTSGPLDGGSPHNYFLTGAELAAGPHTNIPLASVILVNTTVYSVIFDIQDLAGNTATTITNTAVTFDNVPPFVTSIVIVTTPLTGIGTTNGTITTPVQYQVTFSENVTGVDPTDFAITPSGSVTWTIASVTGGPSVYTVAANITPGTTGTARLDFVSNGSVRDIATNPTVTSFSTGGAGATYSIVLPRPTTHVSTFSAVPGGNNYSIQLSWTVPVPTATHYLIRARGQLDDDTNGTYVTATDGTPTPDDFVFTDGNGAVNVLAGTLTYTFNTLLSGKTYTFDIIPYALSSNNSSDNIIYFQVAQPSATATVTTASAGTIAAGSTAAPATISSLASAYGVVNLSFTLQDDGAPITQGLDNARTRFTQLVVKGGGFNTVSNWSDVIAEAELVDITSNPGSPVLTTTIGINTITFSGLLTSPNTAMGVLNDNQLKEYTLRVRLKSTFTGTAPANVDGQTFDFMVDGTSFTYLTAPSQPSRMGASSFSSGTGKNVAAVVATQLTFSPTFGGVQPPATAFVLLNLTTTPVVRAIDANGNTDLNFVSTLTITNSGTLPMNVSTLVTSDNPSPNGGVYTFPAGFQYTDAGAGTANNGNLTVTSGITGSSGNVTVTYSNTTKINAGAFVEPATFSSLLDNTVPLNVINNGVFDFDIVEDNGVGGDGSPTRISQIVINQGAGNAIADWTQAISDVYLYDGINPVFPGTVNSTNLTFSGISFVPGALGYINDNFTKNYRLLIRLKSAMGGSLPSTVDNLNLVFEVLKANITLDPFSSKINPGENQNSGATKNAIDVLSTELRFTNIIGSPTLVSKDISIQQSVPVVEATDIRGNRDLNYNSTTITVTDNGGRAMVNAPLANSLSVGLLTFPNNFQFTAIGGPATLTIATSTVNAASVTPSAAISPAFVVQVGTATTITPGAASPATISSLVNASTGVPVFNFNVNDDQGAIATNDDGVPTLITDIVITQKSPNNTIADWTQAIAGAVLTDGTNSLPVTTLNPTNLTFNGISTATLGLVGDGATKNYTLRIWLKSVLGPGLPATIDGLAFGFEVLAANVTLSPSTTSPSTKIIPGQNHNSGAADVVAVVATSLKFLSPSATASASLNVDFPGISVEAIDANNNRDLNFTGAASTVAAFTIATAGVTTSNGPVAGTTQFGSGATAGLLNFASNFQYITGANGDNVTLTVKAGPGPGTTCGTNGIICGTSPLITLQSSFESSIVVDPTFTFLPTLDYVNRQENVNIQSTATSLEIARTLLVDGSRGATFQYLGKPLYTNTDSGDLLPDQDNDGASTNLNSVTFRITNPSNLRRIALYGNGIEIPGTDIAVTSPAGTAFSDFTFNTGSTLLTAADDNLSTLSIRASFRNTAPEVTDRDPIQISIIAASVTVGSQFFIGPNRIAGVNGGLTVGGVNAGFISPAGVNAVNVLATKLDFTTQPAPFAGINEPVIVGVVEARDQFSIRDLDINSPATLSAAVTINGSFAFANGVLDLTNMQYGSVGDGTFTVTSSGITSNMNNVVGSLTNVSVKCSHVDVMHITTSLATGGVISATNLAGNSINKVIFGVTINTPYSVTTPSSQPLLNKFTISFSNPVSVPVNTVFKNPRIFESQSTTFSGGTSTDVTLPAIGAVLTTGTQSLTINFSGGVPRDLSNPLNATLTYFLMVDIYPTASGSTPPIQPSVVDDGVFGSATNNNIITSKGSSSSSTFGQSYTFASIFPPILTSSFPAKGQLNVDPNQSTVSLTFSVPVWTLDGVIRLYDNQTGGFVNLTATNGAYGTPSPNAGNAAFFPLAQPIVFNIPPAFLVPNHVYYVTIAQGNLSSLTGIMDQANNVFQGFTYSGTLYFKTANPNPPKLLYTSSLPNAPSDPSITNASLTGATVNGTFDQQGLAYFLVLSHLAAVPTNNQIKGSTVYTGFIARGNFAINQTNPISQFGIINPILGSLSPSTTYDVWMYAENNSLPSPVPSIGPYGNFASGFVAGGVGPTLTFVTPAAAGGLVTLNAPSISICNSSYQILNSPIIISEGSNNQFNGGLGVQTLNMVLPAGFQFDVSRTAGAPTYGNLTLIGSDFGGGSLTFLGNSILTIKFTNSTGGSLDKIIISGLRILATTSSSGPMFRLGGTALTAAIPDTTPMGTLSSFDAPTINFDNSYSKSLGNTIANVVTTIPDNADDLDPATAPLTIQLTPANTTLIGDFGPSSFSGPGVNVNILSLQAVTPDVPFNITITHSDNNGCISQNPVQYTVYDHTTAINITTNTGGPHTIPPYPVFTPAIDRSPYCIVNTNFVNSNLIVNPISTPASKKRYFDFNNLPAFYLMKTNPITLGSGLVATIPTPVPLTPLGLPQIINGAAWQTLIQTLPVLENIVSTPPFNPVAAQTYGDFSFDEATILDANARSGGALPDPYSNFRSSMTAQGNFYYTGGSLGLVEFTGTFQSISNATVKIPRKQVVEFFLPAVPLVEIGVGNRSFLDIADPINPVGKDPNNPAKVQVSNTGTPVYCTAGGPIQISGYPAASVGSSTGRFTVRDGVTGTIIYDVPPVGAPTIPPATPSGSAFVDNGNGTASIDPTKLTNTFKDIKITYIYHENTSPCSSLSSQILRITPNPVAAFAWNTFPLTPNAPTASSQCARQAITFNSTSSVAGDPSASVTKWSWNFGDISSSNNIISGTSANSPSHTFGTSNGLGSPYIVSLTASSNYNCASAPPVVAPALPVIGPLTIPVDVGGIPDVKFKLDGVSTADVFNFNSKDASTSTTVSLNDKIVKYDWDFGDLSPHGIVTGLASDAAFNSNVATHQYATPGPKQIDLTVTSNLGCVNSLSLQKTYRSVVVLPRVILPVNGVYVEDFENSNANWQVWGTGKDSVAIFKGSGLATWAWGAPPASIANPPAPLITKTKIWKTNLTGNYNPKENSALYSPSFDLTNLTRAMVSFNSVVQLQPGDGVVMEYATDNLNIADPNKNWLSLGIIGDGEDWFTDQGIAGRPGTQSGNDYGWSGSSNPSWQAPKHILDVLYPTPTNPVLPPSKVVFRLALGTAALIVSKQGFAFDNFRIGDRTRTILLESFVNTGNTLAEEKIENTKVAGFKSGTIGTEVVKINYHVSFPGKDPFNEDNPADPSSRALFYNIVKTPRSRLDGESDTQIPDRSFSGWVPALYNLRSLQLAQAQIAITPVTNPNGSISISVDVTSAVLTGIPSKTILHVAILEDSILLSSFSTTQQAMVKSGETTFDFTLKKMLPSAAGSAFGPVLPFGVKRSFGPFVWTPDPAKLYLPKGDLAVAVFLQQEDAPNEVYQVDIVKNLAEPPVITGLEPIPAEQIIVYPNPANHEMNVLLPGTLKQSAPLQLIDMTGRLSMDSTIPEGANSKVVNTRDLSPGVYILQINVGNGNFTRKKVMIVHEE